MCSCPSSMGRSETTRAHVLIVACQPFLAKCGRELLDLRKLLLIPGSFGSALAPGHSQALILIGDCMYVCMYACMHACMVGYVMSYCYVLLCYVMSVMSCYVMLCYVMLCMYLYV